jgi:hypothetical protein
VITNGAATEAWFEWGETPDLGKKTIIQQFTADSDYYQAVVGLKEQTTYFYKSLVVNANGQSAGRVLSFTTPQCSH